MSWAEVKKINSDLSTPLNHLIWLNDYKTYGQNSYVYQDKNKYNELMSDYVLLVFDAEVGAESYFFASENNELGKALFIHDSAISAELKETQNLREIFQSSTLLSEFISSINSGNILEDLFTFAFSDSSILQEVSDTEGVLSQLLDNGYALQGFYNNYSVATSYIITSPYFDSAWRASSKLKFNNFTVNKTNPSTGTLVNKPVFLIGFSQSVSNVSESTWTFTFTSALPSVGYMYSQSYNAQNNGEAVRPNRFCTKLDYRNTYNSSGSSNLYYFKYLEW